MVLIYCNKKKENNNNNEIEKKNDSGTIAIFYTGTETLQK